MGGEYKKRHKSLAVQYSACNPIFHALQDCQNEHPFTKYFGGCDEFQMMLVKCKKSERAKARELNHQKSIEALRAAKAKILASKENKSQI